ncbi:hypothetical protein AOC36_09775 [Erysipelothrix larvae]|uniref:Methylated-DNA--protein-cysteine methyltransferase n=1 Tax=Erysipelothrix larvae TaxID=1514105 RepID=A0A0X8H1B1_9FIRM|nr:methylated-DNA--[protein]-cysteine S-methyltransferase [Erysipelothrix larvae]AMC94255.1 hypothetical protein AOC36_09775 [Erysipelothrix larvae]
MIYCTTYQSPLGTITLGCDETDHLVGLWFEDQKYFGGVWRDQLHTLDNLEVFKRCTAWLDAYFRGENPSINTLPLNPIGTPFRRDVWDILMEIPYGQTRSYGEISRILAKRKGLDSMSSQAVGGAVGHNPLSILIPCHRVISTDGSLTGYAGGIDRKIYLLELEGALIHK